MWKIVDFVGLLSLFEIYWLIYDGNLDLKILWNYVLFLLCVILVVFCFVYILLVKKKMICRVEGI